ncbi:Xanthine phosphoribosyltransferase [Trichinella pseudospiralis]
MMIKYFTDGRPVAFGWLSSAPLSNKINSQLLSQDYAKLNCPKRRGRAYALQAIAPVDGGAGELSPAPARRSLGALQAPEEDYVLICPTKGLVEKADWTTDWVNKLNNANNADVPQRRACVTAALAVSENFESKTKNFCCCSKNKEMQIHKSPPFRIDSRLMSASRLVASYELNYNGVAAIVALNTHSRQASDDNAYYL